MQGTIINFRGSHKTQHTYQLIIKLPDISSRKEAVKLVNKQVTWKTSSGKEIKGSITSPHGNSGAVRVRFERGLPGQSLGTKVEVS